jgi:predicted DNA-binding protein
VTAGKHHPPSRRRYAAAHPTIGVHCDQETYARLSALRQRSGRSFGRLVRQSLGAVERDIAEVEAREAAARQRGRREGYRQAKALYCLTATCYLCGEPMEIRAGSEMAADAVRAVSDWGHGPCSRAGASPG